MPVSASYSSCGVAPTSGASLPAGIATPGLRISRMRPCIAGSCPGAGAWGASSCSYAHGASLAACVASLRHLLVDPIDDGGMLCIPSRLLLGLHALKGLLYRHVRRAGAAEYIVVIVAGRVGGIRPRVGFVEPGHGVHGGLPDGIQRFNWLVCAELILASAPFAHLDLAVTAEILEQRVEIEYVHGGSNGRMDFGRRHETAVRKADQIGDNTHP